MERTAAAAAGVATVAVAVAVAVVVVVVVVAATELSLCAVFLSAFSFFASPAHDVFFFFSFFLIFLLRVFAARVAMSPRSPVLADAEQRAPCGGRSSNGHVLQGIYIQTGWLGHLPWFCAVVLVAPVDSVPRPITTNQQITNQPRIRLFLLLNQLT